MILNKKNITNAAMPLLFLVVPLFTQAAGPLVTCGNSSDPEQACTLCDLFVMMQGIMQWGMELLFVLAIAGIVISGIMYIISTGNPGMMEKAKGYLKICVEGTLIVLMAWLIVNTVMWLLGATRQGAWFTISDC